MGFCSNKNKIKLLFHRLSNGTRISRPNQLHESGQEANEDEAKIIIISSADYAAADNNKNINNNRR